MNLKITLSHKADGIASDETIELADDVVLKLTPEEWWNQLVTIRKRLDEGRKRFTGRMDDLYFPPQ